MVITKRSIILLAVKSVLSLLALVSLIIIIHEGAHFITALVLAVPIEHFTWFNPNYFAPVFTSVSTEYSMGMTIVSYAGGLVTGVLLLTILAVKRAWFKQSPYRWILGFLFATFGFYQLYLGIFEGAFHDRYVSDATNLFGFTNLVGYVCAFLGMALYCWIFYPALKELRIRGRSN
jgi:hypothetical protein